MNIVGQQMQVNTSAPAVKVSTEPKKTGTGVWVTILHVACIASFCLFMFWGLQGKTPVNGDDIHIIERVNHPTAEAQYDYLRWTQTRRHVVALLCKEYELAGKSFEIANFIWLCIYSLSAFACYFYLRGVFSPIVALTGAIAYLTYSSKYEPLTWWSAGAYTVVWFTFFCIMRLQESRLSFRVKCSLTALVTLGTMYIYEVLTCLIPVFSALLLAKRKREARRLTVSDWLFASLPIVVLLFHLITLASSSKPIYSSGLAQTVRGLPVQQRVAIGFTSALDATLGPKHQESVKQAYYSYRDFYEKEQPALRLLQWTAIALFAIGIIVSLRASIDLVPNMMAVRDNAIIGSVAFLISGIIGFVSNFCVTPSRLTGIPSIGLMIMVCVGLETVRMFACHSHGRMKLILSTVVVALIACVLCSSVREGQAFSSILRQAGQVEEFDLKLARKVKALHPIAGNGDELYVRMQRSPLETVGCWRNFSSGFNTDRAVEVFWYLYDVDPNSFNLTTTPERYPGEDKRMQAALEKWSKKGLEKVFPFYVDSRQNVFPINEIVLTDVQGKVLKRLDFSDKFKNVPVDQQVSQRIPIFSLPKNLRD